MTLLSVFGLIFIVLVLAITFFIGIIVIYIVICKREYLKVFANCKQTGSIIENLFERQRAIGYQSVKYCSFYLSKTPLESGKRLPKKLRSTLTEELEKTYQFAITEGKTAKAALLTALWETQFVIDNFNEIQTTKAYEFAARMCEVYNLGKIIC